MSINIEDYLERYVDTPLTNFPVGEDTLNRMSDVNAITLPLVKQYETYLANDNINAANQLLAANPSLNECLFNATKFNTIRDAIIAMERFCLEDIDWLVTEVAKNTIGINDDPDEEQAGLVAYSAEKVDSLITEVKTIIDNNEKIIPVTFTVSGWTGDEAPYIQTVSVESITENDEPTLIKYRDGDFVVDNVKAYNKAFGIIANGEGTTGNGTLTWKCLKKPAIDITVGLKGFTT